MGTPGSVLGIHLKNAYAKKPRNREERIEMKSTTNFSQIGDNRALCSKKLPGRNKELAPNNIKKTTHARRSSPRRTETKNQIYEIASPASKRFTPAKKAIRGLQLYRFTESARTLRSAVTNTAHKEPSETSSCLLGTPPPRKI